jgi:FdhD protein
MLAVEEPLEIRIGYEVDGKRVHKAVSITMRTPGDDANLAAGFLFTEWIISSPDQIKEVRHCGLKIGKNRDVLDRAASLNSNTIRVDLHGGFDLDLKRLERNFYTTSSCGVCGKASIDALATGTRKIESGVTIRAEIIHTLPDKLRAAQAVFESTGGLHASGIFNTNGELIAAAEDVGRHNALDKVIGSAFLNGGVPMSDKVLMVSGRLSFELVQKAAMAGIPIVLAVGAPSSLAVELSQEMNVTVAGFVRDGRFNIYCGNERIGKD